MAPTSTLPGVYNTTASPLSPTSAPASLQEDANLIVQQIEAALTVLNMMEAINPDGPSTQGNPTAPPMGLAQAVTHAREGLRILNERLVMLQTRVGTL